MLPLIAIFAVLCKLVTAGPCDIYANGGTPCVAAHSTVRSLYNNFNGALYQVFRNSDNTTTNIYPISTGGVANAAAQDSFCTTGTCLITTIYDQSGNGNHLTAAPPGGASSGAGPNGYDFTAGATGAAVTVGGRRAYGVFSSPGTGYRNDNTKNIATGNEPEGLYAIFDGTHYNGNCCYDYGNAETDNHDDGSGTMESIYFGNNGCCGGNTLGEGNGPWIMGDLENGLWAGGSTSNNVNSNNPPIDYRFVTAVVKGNVTNQWAIRGGNSQSGALSTFWSGPRPNNYYPMKKQGAIILGIGGDNSNGAQGTFYEGAMTAGYPSDTTENAVQANIVAAGYATTSQVTSSPAVNQGSTITVQDVTSGQYLSVSGSTVDVSSNPSSFKVVAPLAANSGCYSFESASQSGSYLRHYGFQLYLDNPSTTSRSPGTFNDDATFCPEAGFSGSSSNSFRSYSYPTRFWRAAGGNVYIGAQGGPYAGDQWKGYAGDASWYVKAQSS